MASDDETIDRLSDKELDELTSPDDNPDEADVEDSAHNVNVAAIICGIVAGILFIGAGIWLYLYLRDKHAECALSRQIRQFKGDVRHIVKEADPKRLARNYEVRQAMNTISDYVHEIPGHVEDAASRVRDAISD
ncbi:hypothetical protein PG2093B_0522 [Bifidobacterium pseudolongum subsp. globosum]|uniref:Uncharacterized protein n=1 Tax=Bifidobacterium pseudolongum subsp. globosum TaxID=1690 RepID=A0A4Q5A3L3_9BIFI|nr:hypothetical protein [Bifidobacterium pseudolongum]RYQ11284.1 hypothetical protein PG2093B_0522 [Bifidobacterium pseudolongum subsp. globosum]